MGKMPNKDEKNYVFVFLFYYMARQHPAQKASNQRHGQPAPNQSVWNVWFGKDEHGKYKSCEMWALVKPNNVLQIPYPPPLRDHVPDVPKVIT